MVDDELKEIGEKLGAIVTDHYSRRFHNREMAAISCHITELVILIDSAAQQGDINGGEARKRKEALSKANQTIKLYIEV